MKGSDPKSTDSLPTKMVTRIPLLSGSRGLNEGLGLASFVSYICSYMYVMIVVFERVVCVCVMCVKINMCVPRVCSPIIF